MSTEVNGTYDPAFEPVRAAFAGLFERHPDGGPPDIGSAVSVVVDGRTVVDLWGGWRDCAGTQPWTPHTIASVMSVGKGIIALCVAMLVDRGQLDYDAPVSEYWAEFAAAGKGDVTVGQLMSHQCGLAQVVGFGDDVVLDWSEVVRALEAAAPEWSPGTQHGYHTLTFGHLGGELVRRTDGRDPGTFVREELNAPLGIELLLGLTEREDERAAPRCLQLADTDADAESSLVAEAAAAVCAAANTREWRAAQIPAINLHSDARSLARVYGALARDGEVDGVRLLRPETLDRATREQVVGVDAIRSLAVPGEVSAYSMGWMTANDAEAPLRGEGSFGHGGMFGSWGWASRRHRVGFGYVLNGAYPGRHFGTHDPRGAHLLGAALNCV